MMKSISAFFTTPHSAPAHASVKLFSPALFLGGALMTFVGMTAVPFSARADITITGSETAGGDVVFAYTGMVDLTGLNITGGGAGFSGLMTPASGLAYIASGSFDFYTVVGGAATPFGTGGLAIANLNSGVRFGVNTDGIFVPDNYVSNTAISGMSTYLGTDFATLGIDPNGGYSNAITNFFTLNLVMVPFVTAVPGQPGAVPVSGEIAEVPVPVLAVNVGAIASAETTGLNSIATTLSGVQNAAQDAVGDLNNRIFRARSGANGNGGIASTLDGTSRYLDFAQKQNIDYRVALGLADGETVDIVDTLSSGGGHPFAIVGFPAVSGSAVIAVEGGSGKNSVTDKVVIEEVPHTKYEVFSSFDYGYYDQDNLTRTFRGFEVDSYAGSAGLEVRLTNWLVAGTAFTYLESDSRSTVNLGGNELDGQVYSVYATAFRGNTYLDVLYSYGDFDNDISRNTLLGSTAYGDTESHSHNIDLNLGHTIHLSEKFSFGPSAGLNYTTGEVDGYTERNGGLANLIYPDHDFESMIGRLGGYATFKCDTSAGLLTNHFSAGWAHEFEPDSGAVTTSLQTSPFALVTGNNAQSIGSFTASEERAHAGTDWLELGVTSRLDIKNTGFNVQLGYQCMFGRNNASGHFGSAKVGYEW